jgi:hypothetical protein
MQYKTMVLELLEQLPEMYQQLCSQRQLLATMERLAQELKASHQGLIAQLSQQRPDKAADQIGSEALEIAMNELESRLSCVPPSEDENPLSLDGAMAYLHRHSPPA